MLLNIDNRPLTSIGITPSAITPQWHTAARGQRTFTAIPGQVGQLASGKQGATLRQLVVNGSVKLSALTDRFAAKALVENAMHGRKLIRLLDRPDVQTPAICSGIEWSEYAQAPGLLIPTLLVTLTFDALDGGSEDLVSPGPLLLGTSPVAVALGTLPSAGVLLAFGYTSPLVVTYTPANGVGATTLTVTQTLATGEHIALDLERDEAWLATAAGGRTRITAIAGTWPALDPVDVLDTLNPTLTLSSGTGLLIASRRHRT